MLGSSGLCVCPICHSGEIEALPCLSNAMMSDGRLLGTPLSKSTCGNCGLVTHTERLSASDVEALYSSGYELPELSAEADKARAEVYARVIESVLVRGGNLHQSILDVGCGTGNLLKLISSSGEFHRSLGIDPAISSSTDGGCEFLKGTLADHSEHIGRFDLVVSVNTIEHSADPVEFLQELGECSTEAATIILICPLRSPANLELLFFDHTWSITISALKMIAKQSGWQIEFHQNLNDMVGDFQIFVLKRKSHCVLVAPDGHPCAELREYLEAWQKLDEFFGETVGEDPRPVQIFGAGQLAALLRCYAPGVWQIARRLVCDRPEDAWPLAKAEIYSPRTAANWQTVVAVHPRHQQQIGRRITLDGGRAITLPPAIRR